MIAPATVRALKPGQAASDDVVTGLKVRAFANGRTAYYLWYRTKMGDARQPKLGDCTVMTLAEARAAAKKILLAVANGRDPSQERDDARKSPTMADLWARWREARGLNKKSAAADVNHWNRTLAPKFGAKRVATVTYEDCVEFGASMRATPYMANRLLSLLSTLFAFAERPLNGARSTAARLSVWTDTPKRPVNGSPRVRSYPV